MKKTKKSKKQKQKPFSRACAVSSMMTALGLCLLLMTFAGCAGRPTIHPLKDDFIRVVSQEQITAPKKGAFVSDYFMCKVMEVDVDGLVCKDVR